MKQTPNNPRIDKSTPYNHTHDIVNVFPNSKSYCTICKHEHWELERIRKAISEGKPHPSFI